MGVALAVSRAVRSVSMTDGLGWRGAGKISGVATITIAVRSSASRVLRSIRDGITAPGRNRPDETGDTAISDARSATLHAVHRDAQGLRSRTPSNSDSSDMRPEVAARAQPGTRGLRKSASASCDLSGQTLDLVAQMFERGVVRIASRAHEKIARARKRQHVLTRELPETALQLVPLHRVESEHRHHDGDSGVSERRIHSPDVEIPRANSPTGAKEPLDLRRARYASSGRKPELWLRRRRTCWAAGPSDACVPSSDGGPTFGVPTSSPCARENHGS